MVRILEGDVVEMLRRLEESSVDAIVTDPPYGLEFMGKEWDAPWKSHPTDLDLSVGAPSNRDQGSEIS